MAIGTTPCSLNDNTLVQFIYARALSVIDGALSTRMHYGTSKKIPILLPAQAVLKSFQSARSQHRG